MWNPRVGGEKFVDESRFYKNLGSPPHGRGKEASIFDDGQRLGITPAWAGKRPWMPSDSSSSRDHPRMGGEKDNAEFREKIDQGSPPHGRGKVIVYITAWRVAGITPAMRGKDGTVQLHELSAGITPAWAGKRAVLRLLFRTGLDHPRVGGEKQGRRQFIKG